VLTAFLSYQSSQTATAEWRTVVAPNASPSFGAQADPATDYTPSSGTITFAPGQTSQSVTIPVTGDTIAEPDEYFVVSFANPTNAGIGGVYGLGFCTILNDDGAPWRNGWPIGRVQARLAHQC
jgi:hypothetical protein